ncbi:MAG: hypothetical protein ACTSRK_10745 [Promethearchaeota archaeon]
MGFPETIHISGKDISETFVEGNCEPQLPEFRNGNVIVPKPRPIERYFPLLLAGDLSDRYYNRILKETTVEIRKWLLDRLPPDHKLIELIQESLETKLKNSLSLQL